MYLHVDIGNQTLQNDYNAHREPVDVHNHDSYNAYELTMEEIKVIYFFLIF